MGTATAQGGRFQEGDSSWTRPEFTITLSEPLERPVSIPWRISAGTASEVSDYVGASRLYGVARFDEGETQQAVDFYLYGDGDAEPDESITFEIFPSAGVDLPGGAVVDSAVGWVIDDDGAPEALSLWVSDPKVLEGDNGRTSVVYDVSLSRAAEADVEIPYRIVGDTAFDGEDFEAVSGTALIPRGASETLITFDVHGDEAAEGLEFADLQLDLPEGIAESTGGRLTIVDDDANELPVVMVDATTFSEDDSSWDRPAFSISLSEPAASQVTVPWRIAAGTSTEGVDYAGASRLTGEVRFDPGETHQTVDFYLYGDVDTENDESMIFEITAPDGPAVLPGNSSKMEAVGWIRDDDGRSNPLSLFVSSPEVLEGDGDGLAIFELELSRPAPKDLEIRYQTLDGTARAGEDFEATSGTLTIREGQSAGTVSVGLHGETKVEDAETFSLRVFLDPSVQDLRGGAATIQDDDDEDDFWVQTGTSGRDQIEGYEYRDRIDGGGDRDEIRGYEGRDRLNGGDGRDELWGGAGADRLFGGDGRDKLRGEDGKDRMEGGEGRDKLWGGDGNDRMEGGDGDDKLRGQDGRDRLDGGAGDDKLVGGADADELTGGAGNDTLKGNRGADVYVFGADDGTDTIRGFEDGADVIRITEGADEFDDLDVRDAGRDVTIAFADTEIVLRKESFSNIGAEDFVFG